MRGRNVGIFDISVKSAVHRIGRLIFTIKQQIIYHFHRGIFAYKARLYDCTVVFEKQQFVLKIYCRADHIFAESSFKGLEPAEINELACGIGYQQSAVFGYFYAVYQADVRRAICWNIYPDVTYIGRYSAVLNF